MRRDSYIIPVVFLFLLVWVSLPASAGERVGRTDAVSAVLQATATVEAPLGMTDSGSIADSLNIDGESTWLVRFPRQEGVLIRVQTGARESKTYTLNQLQDKQGAPAEIRRARHLRLINSGKLLSSVPDDSDSCLVTIIYAND